MALLKGHPLKSKEVVVEMNEPYAETDAILSDSHIIGSHTVHLKPLSIAKLNPNGTSFCLPLPGFEITVPLLIKGNPPFYIDYSLFTVNGETEFNNVLITKENRIKLNHDPHSMHPSYITDILSDKDESSQDIGSQKDNYATALYGIIVRSEGVYKIKAIREYTGESGKIVKTEPLHIAHCPEVSWSWAGSNQALESANKPRFDVCVEDSIHASLTIKGVMPVTVLYLVKSGETESIEVVQQGNGVTCSDSDSEIECKIKLQTSSTEKIPIEMYVDSENNFEFKVVRVTDGLNNSIEFDSATRTSLPPINGKGTYFKIADTTDNSLLVSAHSHPTTFFNTPDSKIRTFYDPAIESAPVVNIELQFTGTKPFVVNYEFIPEDEASSVPNTIENINSYNINIETHQAGIFKLIDVTDRHCRGSVSNPSQMTVRSVLPPTCDIQTEPIQGENLTQNLICLRSLFRKCWRECQSFLHW